MKPTVTDRTQISFLLPDLESQINLRHPLCRLVRAMDWGVFEKEFGAFYCSEGRPALPIRRMVGLLMLKSLRNHSDEGVVEFWNESPYTQYFCGEREFQCGWPCEASAYEKRKARNRFRRRAAIEPRIGHLKSDFRLGRNFLKGQLGDAINLLLAAAASNLSLWMRQVLFALYSEIRKLAENLGRLPRPLPASGFFRTD